MNCLHGYLLLLLLLLQLVPTSSFAVPSPSSPPFEEVLDYPSSATETGTPSSSAPLTSAGIADLPADILNSHVIPLIPALSRKSLELTTRPGKFDFKYNAEEEKEIKDVKEEFDELIAEEWILDNGGLLRSDKPTKFFARLESYLGEFADPKVVKVAVEKAKMANAMQGEEKLFIFKKDKRMIELLKNHLGNADETEIEKALQDARQQTVLETAVTGGKARTVQKIVGFLSDPNRVKSELKDRLRTAAIDNSNMEVAKHLLDFAVAEGTTTSYDDIIVWALKDALWLIYAHSFKLVDGPLPKEYLTLLLENGEVTEGRMNKALSTFNNKVTDRGSFYHPNIFHEQHNPLKWLNTYQDFVWHLNHILKDSPFFEYNVRYDKGSFSLYCRSERHKAHPENLWHRLFMPFI